MNIQQIIAGLDNEIARLTQVRALLTGSSNDSRIGRKPRTISAEGRKRIADAQRKRWAKRKKGILNAGPR